MELTKIVLRASPNIQPTLATTVDKNSHQAKDTLLTGSPLMVYSAVDTSQTQRLSFSHSAHISEHSCC